MKKIKKCKKIIFLTITILFIALLAGCTKKYYFPEYVCLLQNKNLQSYIEMVQNTETRYYEKLYADEQGRLVCKLDDEQKDIMLEKLCAWFPVVSASFKEDGVDFVYSNNYTGFCIVCSKDYFESNVDEDILRNIAISLIDYQVLNGVKIEDLHVKISVIDIDTQELLYENELSEEAVNNAETTDYIMPSFLTEFVTDIYNLYSAANVTWNIQSGEQFIGMYEFVFIDEYDNITFRLTEEQRKAWYDMLQDEYLAEGIDFLADMGCDVEYSDDFKTAQVSCTEELVSEMCVPEEDGDIPYKEVTKYLALPLMMSQIFSGVQSEDLTLTISFVDVDTGDTITEVNYAAEKE